MQNNQITISSMILPEAEVAVESLKTELTEEAIVGGKQGASRANLLTETEFAVLVTNPYREKAQATLNFVRQRGQIWAHLHNTKEAEQQAVKQGEKLQIEYNEKERQLTPLDKKKAAITGVVSKSKQWLWFVAACVVVGCADGVLSYSSFRFSYSVLLASMMAMAIAAAISCSHFAFVPWIKKAKGRLEKWAKIAAVLAIAAVFFYFIGSLRVSAANTAVSVNPNAQTEPTHPSGLSALAISTISFILFCIMAALALRFYISPEEKKQENEYKKICAEIDAIKADMLALKAKKEKLASDVIRQKSEVRNLASYLKRTFEVIKTTAESARKEYKKVYGQYRHEMPGFFADDTKMVFDDDLHLFNDLQNEQLS